MLVKALVYVLLLAIHNGHCAHYGKIYSQRLIFKGPQDQLSPLNAMIW